MNNLKDIKILLGFIKKNKYYEYIKEKSLGADILYLLNKNQKINKSIILLWVNY